MLSVVNIEKQALKSITRLLSQWHLFKPQLGNHRLLKQFGKTRLITASKWTTLSEEAQAIAISNETDGTHEDLHVVKHADSRSTRLSLRVATEVSLDTCSKEMQSRRKRSMEYGEMLGGE